MQSIKHSFCYDWDCCSTCTVIIMVTPATMWKSASSSAISREVSPLVQLKYCTPMGVRCRTLHAFLMLRRTNSHEDRLCVNKPPRINSVRMNNYCSTLHRSAWSLTCSMSLLSTAVGRNSPKIAVHQTTAEGLFSKDKIIKIHCVHLDHTHTA